MSLYIGVDLGTQSLKVLVYDADKRAIISRASHPCAAPLRPRPGAAEQAPADWWQAFESAMHAALENKEVDLGRIRAIGVSGQQHGMVALDKTGQVIRPAKLWCDVEAAEEAGILSSQAQRHIPAGFTAPKLLWLKNNEPENFRRMQRLCLPHDWLNWRLTGNWVTDHGDASGNGLYDPNSQAIDEQLAGFLDADLAKKLPPIEDCQAWHGRLQAEIARTFGLSENVKVSIGSGDNMMSAIGAGAIQPGQVVASLGTSGTLFGISTKPVTLPDSDLAPFRDATGNHLPLYCLQNCSSAIEEVHQSTERSLEELTAEAADLEPASGPLFLPYLTGERSPHWPHASGVLFGIRPSKLQPAALFRAAMEGVSYGLYRGAQQMYQAGLEITDLRVVGGGAQNPLWCQILADLFQVPVMRPIEIEAAALGAALQACAADSEDFHQTLMEHAPATHKEILKPSSVNRKIYRTAAEKMHQLGASLFA